MNDNNNKRLRSFSMDYPYANVNLANGPKLK